MEYNIGRLGVFVRRFCSIFDYNFAVSLTHLARSANVLFQAYSIKFPVKWLQETHTQTYTSIENNVKVQINVRMHTYTRNYRNYRAALRSFFLSASCRHVFKASEVIHSFIRIDSQVKIFFNDILTITVLSC